MEVSRNTEELRLTKTKLGSGGYATVYLGYLLKNDTEIEVAVKKLYHFRVNKFKINLKFSLREEIRILTDLQDNKFILKFISSQKVPRGMLIITERLFSRSVNEVTLAIENKKERAEVIIILSSAILNAISYIHNKDYIHRDIKPANILLTFDGIPKICDFGLTKEADKCKLFAGSLAFKAPEMILHYRYSNKCDAFSYGLTVAHMFTDMPSKSYLGIIKDRLVLLKVMKRLYHKRNGKKAVSDYKRLVESTGLYENIDGIEMELWNLLQSLTWKGLLVIRPEDRMAVDEFLEETSIFKEIAKLWLDQDTDINNEYRVMYENSRDIVLSAINKLK